MSGTPVFDDCYTPKMEAKGRGYFLFWNSKANLGFPEEEVHGARLQRRRVELVDYDLMAHEETGDDSISIIPFQVISWRPRAFYFPNFATPEQCQHIINMAKPNFNHQQCFSQREKPSSQLMLEPGWVRFSMLMNMRPGFWMALKKRLQTPQSYQQLTTSLELFGEMITMFQLFNILRYGLGRKYNSHYDVFDPERYGPQKSQRGRFAAATFLLYLLDVEDGGETEFPFENGLNMEGNYDYRKCIGLKVKPRLGDGILFYSLFPNNSIDPTSVHGSCPVIKEAKWVATK